MPASVQRKLNGENSRRSFNASFRPCFMSRGRDTDSDAEGEIIPGKHNAAVYQDVHPHRSIPREAIKNQITHHGRSSHNIAPSCRDTSSPRENDCG